jgi:hypothetical protein
MSCGNLTPVPANFIKPSPRGDAALGCGMLSVARAMNVMVVVLGHVGRQSLSRPNHVLEPLIQCWTVIRYRSRDGANFDFNMGPFRKPNRLVQYDLAFFDVPS